MSDDLRNRVARAIANVREGGWPADTYALLQQHYLMMADAALAEIGAVRVKPATQLGCDMPSTYVASGHHASNIGATHIDTFGFGPLMIRDGRRTWFFEFSEMFGPVVLRRDGRHFEVKDKQPISERDPFWRPFKRWMHSGRKVRPIKTKRGRIRFYLCHAPKKDT